MATEGFFEQRQNSPAKLGTVILLHTAAIAGVLMIRQQYVVTPPPPPTTIRNIRLEPPPPVEPPVQPETHRETLPPEHIDRPPVEVTTPTPPLDDRPLAPIDTGPTTLGGNGLGTGTTSPPPPTTPPPPPPREVVRQNPTMLSGSMQPPYPVSEIRAGNEGSVRVRVSIDANGRVTAVEKLSGGDAFFQATQRYALSRWRFRPATEDGRPVAGSTILTVHFRLDNAG